jgi:LPS-assembly protein
MTSRTRLIITALLACHLFLQPGLLTSQLRPAAAQENSGEAAARSDSPDLGSTPGNPAENKPLVQPPSVAPLAQVSPTKPGISVTTDTGQEDDKTEQLIQQELQTSSSDQELGPPRPAINVPLGRNEVLIRADEQEKDKDIYKCRGHVEIRFRTNILHADQATYDSTTGQVTAVGHVVFDGGKHNEHLVGTHATYDVSRDTGTFYDVTGSTGARVKNHIMFLTSSTPFFFTGKVVDKLGPDLYRVNHGYITSCQLPKPKWRFESQTAMIEMGEEAKMHHATLRIHGIPVFYFPFVEHPVDNLGRKSGFLMPAIGQSNTRGSILGDGFYWAINRNSDAVIGASLYSKRGWAQHGIYRAVGYKYLFRADYFGVVDQKGYPPTGQNQGGEELRANGFLELPDEFHGALSVDYLSSYIFRLAFAENYAEAINSEVRSNGYIYRDRNGYSLGYLVARYQDYQSEAPGDVIDIAHLSTFEFSSLERPFNRSRLMYSYDFAVEGLSRHEIGFQTAPAVGRLDAYPHVSMPTFLHGWTLRPEAGVRETYYTQRLETEPRSTTVVAVSNPINRNVFSGSMDIRPPSFAKIFDRKLFGYVWKHTVEPRVTYRYQTGINDFSQIIRFDQRDILVDTNEVEYGVVNRLYAKKTKSTGECFRNPKYNWLTPAAQKQTENAIHADIVPEIVPKKDTCDDKQGPARDVVTWEIAQKYFMNPTFGGALVPGQTNVFDSTVDFTGIAFLTEPRKFSPIISRLRIQDASTDFGWALDYDPVLDQINASTVYAGRRWGNWYLSTGQSYLNVPPPNPDIFDQYRVMLLYGNISKRGFTWAAAVGVDSRLHYIQSATIQTNYNWDCCGVTFEYQRFALGAVRNENWFHFAFSLTNVGSFGSIKQSQRLY